MTFSNFYEDKKKIKHGLVDPKDIPALKSQQPREKTRQNKTLGRKPFKKKKFGAKDRVKRSRYDKAIGRRKRKGGKTKNARQILASKHGIKKAIDKDNNAEYYYDHLKIAELMKKFGYDWQDQDGSWQHKEEREATKPKKKRVRRKKFSLIKPKVGRPEDPEKDKDRDETELAKIDKEAGTTDDEPFVVKRHGKDVTVDEKDLTYFTIIGAGGIEYDVTEEDIMTYEARLILALIHGKHAMLKFEEFEETEEDSAQFDDEKVTVISIEPLIEREKVLDRIEELGYEYWPELDEWKIDDKFPFPENEEVDEDKKSIIGRSYLTAMGYFEAMSFERDNTPSGLSKDEVLDLMSEHGLVWDETNTTWEVAEDSTVDGIRHSDD